MHPTIQKIIDSLSSPKWKWSEADAGHFTLARDVPGSYILLQFWPALSGCYLDVGGSRVVLTALENAQLYGALIRRFQELCTLPDTVDSRRERLLNSLADVKF